MNIRSHIMLVGVIAVSSLLSACGGGGGDAATAASSSTTLYSIGGSVQGLGTGVSISLHNSTEQLTVGNGAFKFPTGVFNGGGYNVLLDYQPTGYTCSLANASGSNVTSNISNVLISCMPVAAVTLSLSQAWVVAGQSIKITWTASNATSCSAADAWSGSKGLSGEEVLSPTQAGVFSYSLSCLGAGGTVTQTVPLQVYATSVAADAVAAKFDKAQLGSSVQTVFGISKKPADYSSPQLVLGVPAKSGDTVSAADIVKMTNLVINPDATYSFALQANISSIWKNLDITTTVLSKVILDGIQITRPPLSPGATYASKNSTQPIVVQDSNWFAGRPNYGMTDGGVGPYSVTLPGSELGRLSFLVGGEMSVQIFIQAPPNGNFVAIFDRGFYNDTTPAGATTGEYLDALSAFGSKYQGVSAPNGCTLITQLVSVAIGSPLPWAIWNSSPVANPNRAGHWSAIYKGDAPNPVKSWSALLKPGDVVNLVLNGGAQHTISVISAKGKTIETIDNIGGGIGHHTYDYESISDPSTITIYRMDSSYDASEIRVLKWLESVYPEKFAGTSPAEYSNGYVLKRYSSNWSLGVKANVLYAISGNDGQAYSLGAFDGYLKMANLNGY